MKTNNFLIFIMVSLLLLTSCKKYLDIKTESPQITAQTAQDCQRLLDDYATMNTGYPGDAEASSDDYYLNTSDYQNPPVPLLQEDKEIYIWSSTAIRDLAAPQWQNSYKIVFNANLVLETLQKLNDGNTDQQVLNTLKGSALFFKSYAYWHLAQLYTQPYSAATANQNPGIPLRNSTDIKEVSTRGTLQQTYDQILKDLQEATILLPTSSSIPTRPNKVAAYAMLARIYLAKEDYPSALNSATTALQIKNELLDYNTLDSNAFIAFDPRFNKEVIFHSVMTREAIMTPGNDFLPFARIDSMLIRSYSSNDLRKPIFFKPNYDLNTFTPDGSYRFVGNYEPTFNFADFFNGLAVDELYLIRAECYARAGQLVQAMADLNALLKMRWKSGTYVNLTASSSIEALDKILSERRKELLMRGIRWTDLRRLNKDTRFAKMLTRKVNGSNYSLPPNDPRYTLLIPKEVIMHSGIAQNTR